MSELIKIITEADFESHVMRATVPVLVDFWAEWCGPCRTVAPILEDIAGQYTDKLKIFKLNVDENNTVSAKYAIRSIPSFLLFKNGELVATTVGALTKSQFLAFIDSHL